MKKKTMVWAYLIILSLGTILSLYIPKNEVAAKDAIVIPGQAIRLRILANSDLDSDQALKRKVRDAVNAKISVWVGDLTSIQEARKVIKSKLPEIEATAKKVVKDEGSKQKVNVKFGKVQFPTKLYGQFLYPAGDYEAILITLGKGEGANWWCVLFPPLCFLDFSNGIAVSKGFDDKKQQGASKSEQPVQQSKAESTTEADTESATKAKTAAATEQDTDSATKAKTAAATEQDTDSVTKAKAAPAAEAKAESVTKAKTAPAAEAKAESATKVKTEPATEAKTNAQVYESENRKATETANQKTTENTEGKTAVKAQKPAHVPNLAEKEMQADEAQPENGTAAAQEKDSASKPGKNQQAPVYTSQDEEPIKVKFFVVELWDKIF